MKHSVLIAIPKLFGLLLLLCSGWLFCGLLIRQAPIVRLFDYSSGQTQTKQIKQTRQVQVKGYAVFLPGVLPQFFQNPAKLAQ